MNKLIFGASLALILSLHFIALSFSLEKEELVVTKPKYQKISHIVVEIRKVSYPKVVNQITKKVLEKKEPLPPKKIFNKPIKKNAIRKKVKKIIKKKVVKKKEVKKIIKKKQVKQPIKKKEVEKKKVIPKPLAPVASAQSLEKTKKFKKHYLIELRTAIDRNKRYPSVSKRLEEEGTVLVTFKVLQSGVFQDIQISKSSGKKRLDRAAIKAVTKLQKFKPFAKYIKKKFMDIRVPIQFKLNK